MIHPNGKLYFVNYQISNYAGFVANYLVGDKYDGCWSVVGFVMSLFSFLI